ncbi:MAG: endonuclease/exonuclease/phosphatase family protein [Candidatus Hydrogenedentes bacterium]|nr:endonuclease/exonuclease/phosphatase family protein [Candidatus Hydrogenedentota bacterium]
MNRRTFLLESGAACAMLWGTGTRRAWGAEARFRTITYNLRECTGWGLRKEQQERLARLRPQLPERTALELALYDAGVVTLIEAPPEDVVAHMARTLGMEYRHANDASPGAVLTRCNILDWNPMPEGDAAPYTREQRPKHCARAVLETALGPVILYSIHFTARNEERRLRELATSLNVMKDDIASGQSLVVQGDLNHSQQAPEYARWVDAGLQDVFRLKGAGIAQTLGAAKPAMRIDYIWVHGPLAAQLQECRVLFEGAFRTNPEDPGSVGLSDHLPLMATFGAP